MEILRLQSPIQVSIWNHITEFHFSPFLLQKIFTCHLTYLIKQHYFTYEITDLETELGNCPLVTKQFMLLTKLFLVRNRNDILKRGQQQNNKKTVCKPKRKPQENNRELNFWIITQIISWSFYLTLKKSVCLINLLPTCMLSSLP